MLSETHIRLNEERVAQMPNASAPKILVIDDDPTDRKLFRRILEAAGYSVADVGSGTEALERLTTTTFDLMLVDISMPELDGLELLHCIRDMPAPKPHIIVTTGHPPLLEIARLLGVTTTLDKSEAQDGLVTMVRAILKNP
jgi:CheY-like chemotaxis protein